MQVVTFLTRRGRARRRLLIVNWPVSLLTTGIALLCGCASSNTPMTHQEEVMTVPWGPFARQCTTTRTSHYVFAGKAGLKEVDTNRHDCIGFSAMPATGGAEQITGSAPSGDGSENPIIYRILRAPNGISRPAAAGDTGLLAQGSDNTAQAETFAEQIGLTRQQTIDPRDTVRLPIVLHVPSAVSGTLQCRPDGGGVDRGRKTLVLSCTLDEQVHTDSLDANLRLAGVEEVDVMTGVRLSGSFAGSLSGQDKANPQARAEHVDDHVWYQRTMDLE
jgi:hypothetical protein